MEMEIDIKQIFNIILKWLWLIILLPVIAGGITAYINFMVLEPIYYAETTLLITGTPGSTTATNTANTANTATDTSMIDFENIVIGQTLVSEYSEIIRSKRVISAAIKDINDDTLTEENLRSMISIGSVNDTRIIYISVDNYDPEKAAQYTNSVAKAFSQEVVRLYKIGNVEIIDFAEVPYDPILPTKTKNIAIALLAALVLALGIIFVIEYLDNTIKNSEDVEKHLGINVIGSIPLNSIK